MDEKITLKFQKLHIVTTLGWALILFLALISRGVLSNFAFWLIFIMISILFVLDAIYFVIRVIDGHFLVVSNREVIIKRLFKPIESMLIAELISITYIDNGPQHQRIMLSNGEREIEIKHIYKFSKESILVIIQESSNFPKNLEVTRLTKNT